MIRTSLKPRTPLQDWATQRWAFKGALCAAQAMIKYHLRFTELAHTEKFALQRMSRELKRLLDIYKVSQKTTGNRVRRRHAKTRTQGHNACSARG